MKARKPKKALVQFAVAAIIAVVVAVVAVGFVFLTISGINAYNDNQQQQLAEQVNQAQEEIDKLKKLNKSLTVKRKRHELVALVDIEPNTVVTRSMVDLVEVEKATPGALTKLDTAVGQRAIIDIVEGDTITYPKLASPNGVPKIPIGMRAISIAIPYVAGLNGKLLPGAYVDVLVTLETEDEIITRTLIQRVKIVSVKGQEETKAGYQPAAQSGAWSVTLAVTPEQAEAVALAHYQGTFHLTLRNNKDEEVPTVYGMDVAHLLSGTTPEALTRELPDPFQGTNGALSEVFVSNPSQAVQPNLPSSGTPASSKGTFTMEIFRGGSSETKTFEPQFY